MLAPDLLNTNDRSFIRMRFTNHQSAQGRKERIHDNLEETGAMQIRWNSSQKLNLALSGKASSPAALFTHPGKPPK